MFADEKRGVSPPEIHEDVSREGRKSVRPMRIGGVSARHDPFIPVSLMGYAVHWPVSSEDQETLRRTFGIDCISTVPAGVDTDFFLPTDAPTLGGLTWEQTVALVRDRVLNAGEPRA